ncbi:MAG: hypothetical protein AVDCRST_MAG49-2466, partial [uncultured Thermomicrobiales bacterium]
VSRNGSRPGPGHHPRPRRLGRRPGIHRPRGAGLAPGHADRRGDRQPPRRRAAGSGPRPRAGAAPARLRAGGQHRRPPPPGRARPLHRVRGPDLRGRRGGGRGAARSAGRDPGPDRPPGSRRRDGPPSRGRAVRAGRVPQRPQRRRRADRGLGLLGHGGRPAVHRLPRGHGNARAV